jgi:hypothetical protein
MPLIHLLPRYPADAIAFHRRGATRPSESKPRNKTIPAKNDEARTSGKVTGFEKAQLL